MIFFINEENYERFKEQKIFPEDRAEFVNMTDCKGFAEAGSPASVKDMFGTMRLIYEDSKLAKKEEIQKYYDASEKLLKKFIGE